MFKWREWRGFKGEKTIATAEIGTLVEVLYDGEDAFQRVPISHVDWTNPRWAPAIWRPAQG